MYTGILTFPIAGNYGGMIQTYALYTILEELNYNPFVFSYKRKGQTLKQRIKDYVKFLLLYITPSYKRNDLPLACNIRVGKRFMKICDQFRFFDLKKLTLLRKRTNIQWVIGSDQVWRSSYVNSIASLPFFFLDFVNKSERENSISYAASFGINEWEGSDEDIKKCRKLIREFKTISVREHAGIDICRNILQRDAIQIPDPTLLLNDENYARLIEKEIDRTEHERYIGVYVLDYTHSIKKLLYDVSIKYDCNLMYLMPRIGDKKRKNRLPISVPCWLRYIRDCEYFITDSFHGCVFAIIFNKPFVCLGNDFRGGSRFMTLLNTFRLRCRLVNDTSSDKIINVLNTPIDWQYVNEIREKEQQRGIQFLKHNLTH